MLGGSWDLVSKVLSTVIGAVSIVTLIITLVTKSHDPLSGASALFLAVGSASSRIYLKAHGLL